MSLKLLLALVATTVVHAAAASAEPADDWPTYGFDSLRTSYNPKETALSVATVHGLKQLWEFNAGAFDKALNKQFSSSAGVIGGQPIVAGGVTTAAGTTDLVLVGDNNGTFFALDANSTDPTGSVVWYRSLPLKIVGAPINKAYGIRATAALDPRGAGIVYVADNVQVYGLDLATGATLAGWPVADEPADAPDTDGEIHDALNLVADNIYFGTAGVGYDQPPFYGRVSSISTLTQKVTSSWYSLSGTSQQPTLSGGGVWGWGGVAVDTQSSGGIYVATGNVAGNPPQQQVYAENVIHLKRNLTTILGAATPTFPPTGDDDYGSTPLVFTPAGCSTKLAVTKSKTGLLVVDAVASDGSMTVAQTLQVSTTGGNEFKGTSAFDPVDQLVLVTLDAAGSAAYQPGLAAFQVTSSCAAPWLSLAWQTSQTASGKPIMPDGGHISSPTVANGLVFFGAETPAGGDSIVYAVLARPDGAKPAGTIAWASGVVPGTFDSALPTVVNGKLFFSTASKAPTIYGFGLPASSPRR